MDEFIHGVTTRLTGKVIVLYYKKPKTYEELKVVLNATADKKQTLNRLHSKLSMFKMNAGETIQQYSERAEQLYYDILESSIATNEIANTEELAKITAIQVLTAFTEGLPHDTRILVKASRPKELSDAVQVALEEETSRSCQKEMRKNISEYKSHHKSQPMQGNKLNPNNRARGACFLCGRTNHQARQCRASIADRER